MHWIILTVLWMFGCTQQKSLPLNNDKNILLSQAIESEKLDVVEQLLKDGADPNGFYVVNGVKKAETFLFVAIRRQNSALIEKLIQFGADPNRSSGKYENAIAYAVMHVQRPAVFQTLLKAHAKPPLKLPNDQSLLEELLELNNLEVALLLIDAGAQFENEIEKALLICNLLKSGNESYLWFWLKNNPEESHYRFPSKTCGSYQSMSLMEIANKDPQKITLKAALIEILK